MAKIKFGKEAHLALEISPLSIWSNPGSEGEFMEYQLGLYCEGKSVFDPHFSDRLVAVKDEEMIYLSDFILQTLQEHKENNWMMLEPKVSIYMYPVQNSLGCCSSYNPKDMFMMQLTLEQNIFAGEDKVFGPYSNTGITINFEAEGSAWAKLAADLRTEEEDFDEEE